MYLFVNCLHTVCMHLFGRQHTSLILLLLTHNTTKLKWCDIQDKCFPLARHQFWRNISQCQHGQPTTFVFGALKCHPLDSVSVPAVLVAQNSKTFPRSTACFSKEFSKDGIDHGSQLHSITWKSLTFERCILYKIKFLVTFKSNFQYILRPKPASSIYQPSKN